MPFHSRGVVSKHTTPADLLVHIDKARHNRLMKGIAWIIAVAGVLLGICYYYLKKMPKADPGTAPTQAISLTGVRSDLLQIGQAERGSIALNGKCSSLDDLISSGALTINRNGRISRSSPNIRRRNLVPASTFPNWHSIPTCRFKKSNRHFLICEPSFPLNPGTFSSPPS
jgi:hypothetical protein